MTFGRPATCSAAPPPSCIWLPLLRIGNSLISKQRLVQSVILNRVEDNYLVMWRIIRAITGSVAIPREEGGERQSEQTIIEIICLLLLKSSLAMVQRKSRVWGRGSGRKSVFDTDTCHYSII